MASNVQLVVGLGNPGSQYEQTRHNAGVWFVEALARAYDGQFRHQSKFNGDVAEIMIGTSRLRLLRPDTFMNESGRAVGPIANFYKLVDLGIVLIPVEPRNNSLLPKLSERLNLADNILAHGLDLIGGIGGSLIILGHGACRNSCA